MKVRIQIEDMPFTLLRVADKGNLKKLSFEGKIKWLEERVKLVLINPYREALDHWEDKQLGMFLVTGLCAGISATSTFLKGGTSRELNRSKGLSDRKFFCDFVEKYMAAYQPILCAQPKDISWRNLPPNTKAPKTWADWLYLYVRNGLAHAFTIEQGGFHKPLESLISQSDDTNEPIVAADRLLEAFEKGWDKYLSEVRNGGPNSKIGKKFEKRWDKLFVLPACGDL